MFGKYFCCKTNPEFPASRFPWHEPPQLFRDQEEQVLFLERNDRLNRNFVDACLENLDGPEPDREMFPDLKIEMEKYRSCRTQESREILRSIISDIMIDSYEKPAIPLSFETREIVQIPEELRGLIPLEDLQNLIKSKPLNEVILDLEKLEYERKTGPQEIMNDSILEEDSYYHGQGIFIKEPILGETLIYDYEFQDPPELYSENVQFYHGPYLESYIVRNKSEILGEEKRPVRFFKKTLTEEENALPNRPVLIDGFKVPQVPKLIPKPSVIEELEKSNNSKSEFV